MSEVRLVAEQLGDYERPCTVMGAKRLASYTAKTFQPSASSSAGYQGRLTTRDVLQFAVTVVVY